MKSRDVAIVAGAVAIVWFVLNRAKPNYADDVGTGGNIAGAL